MSTWSKAPRQRSGRWRRGPRPCTGIEDTPAGLQDSDMLGDTPEGPAYEQGRVVTPGGVALDGGDQDDLDDSGSHEKEHPIERSP